MSAWLLVAWIGANEPVRPTVKFDHLSCEKTALRLMLENAQARAAGQQVPRWIVRCEPPP